MADSEGTGAALRVDVRHQPFLREYFEIHRAGRLGDLAEPHGADEATLGRIRAAADICGRILDGLERGEIALDPEVSAMLLEEAAATDAGDNDYERVVAEHEAFAHLIRQLGAGGRDAELQRVVLCALLEPPRFGAFIGDLAVGLGEREPNIESAAAALRDRLLVTVQDRYVAATGPAIEFDALWPERRREEGL